MKLVLRYLLSLILFFYCTLLAAETDKSSQITKKFITVADIHFDPFYSCKNLPAPCATLRELQTQDYHAWDSIFAKTPMPFSGNSEDTNYPLLQSTLLELKKINQSDRPQFVLILGDFIAHHFNKKYKKYSGDISSESYVKFVNKTFQFLTYQLNKVFPNTNIYPVIGNNDSYTGNYIVIPNGRFLQDMTKIWGLLIKNEKNKMDLINLFHKNGYYSIALTPNEKIIVLNTVLFSLNVHKKNMNMAAKDQLYWLREQLKVAQKNHFHVILAYHIPENSNVLSSIQFFLLPVKQFWQRHYIMEYDKILKQFSDTIIAILPGHTHINSYRVNQGTTHIPIIFTPSISPIYGNRPGFNVVTYEPDHFEIKDYVTYFYSASSNQWDLEYSFSQNKNIITKSEKTHYQDGNLLEIKHHLR